MALGVTRRPSPPEDASRVVVLVHGILAGPAVLEPLAGAVRDTTGLPVVAYGYRSSRPFDAIVEGLARFLEDEVPASATVALVGHSLGGLVCRAYLQRFDDTGRVDRLVSIACPHRGTRLARILPTSLGRSLRPGSETLRELESTRVRLRGLHVTTIHAQHDPIGADHDVLDGAARHDVVCLDGVAHNSVLFDARALALVASAVGGRARTSQRPRRR